MYKFLNLISECIFFTLGRDGKVEFLLSDGYDIMVKVNKVCGGLKVDFAMVGVHLSTLGSLTSSGRCGVESRVSVTNYIQ